MLKPPSILPCGVALLLTIGISAPSLAGNDYRCTIERYSRAGGDTGPTYKMLQGMYVGQQFTVDRSSGVTIGILKNNVDTKPLVIDRGSKENSFKVVSSGGTDEFHAGSTVSALNVMEFVAGRKKPFNYLFNDDVFFGICEPF